MPGTSRLPGSARLLLFLAAAYLTQAAVVAAAGRSPGTQTIQPVSCQRGCPKLFAPVCGQDGHTYCSSCLAQCQGIEIAHDGPCPGESLMHEDNSHAVVQDESLIQPHHLTAFALEGFKYAGQVKLNTKPMDPKTAPDLAAHRTRLAQLQLSMNETHRQYLQKQSQKAVRVTRDGHVYVSETDSYLQTYPLDSQSLQPPSGFAAGMDIFSAAATLPEPFDIQSSGRSLLGIFGDDDRIDCPRTVTYPFSATGQINVRDRTGNYVCSGALVGPDVVLTAAHCVFSRANQGFYDTLDFSPGRYLSPEGKIVNPLGTVSWAYVTTYQGYSTVISPDPNVWDVAVIKLASKIGLTAGWMGVYEPCKASAPSKYISTTAGYPSDMPAGSCKTCQCQVTQDPCTDAYLYHKCDTAAGQSGSPMWMMAMTAAKKMGPYIRAVHNIEWVQSGAKAGTSQTYINSAVSVNPDHYRTLLAWITPSFAANPEALNHSQPMAPAPPPRQLQQQ